ncbi:MAG: polysaccharide pyruvyl transferase family protein [Ruminococcus sp.]|nr:polysaccharide pyruvyl transferase family protein [Ruminococcus sp.]
MGYTVDIIDYRSNKIEGVYYPTIRIKPLKYFPLDLLLYSSRRKKWDSFKDCVDDKLQPADFDVNRVNKEYDIFITGSDQIWNYSITGNDRRYYLDFVDGTNRRISYAACSDKFFPSEAQLDNVREDLLRFDEISVRDEQTAHFVKKISGREPAIVLDPTFLLAERQWKEFAGTVGQENYILVFSVGYSERLSDFAHSLAAKTGKQVAFLNSGFKKKGRGIYLDALAPDAAVGYFMNADYVVTNSFHGTAMSLIFAKEFFVELDHDKKGRNLRVEDMLSRFCIKGREIKSGIYNNEDFDTLDYEVINNKIATHRDESRDWLVMALSRLDEV